MVISFLLSFLSFKIYTGAIQDGELESDCISSLSRTQDSRRAGIERLGLKYSHGVSLPHPVKLDPGIRPGFRQFIRVGQGS